MRSVCSWVSCLCRQKRILILLCTFGSSFIAFNYSLLSSTTIGQSLSSFSSNKISDDESYNNGIPHQKSFAELDNMQKHDSDTSLRLKIPVSSPSQISSPIISLSRKRRISARAQNDDEPPFTQIEQNSQTIKDIANSSEFTLFSQSLSQPVVSRQIALQKKTANVPRTLMDDHRLFRSKNISVIVKRSRNNRKFVSIKQKENGILTTNESQEYNHVRFPSLSQHGNNVDVTSVKINTNDNNVKTDEIKIPTLASSSLTSTVIAVNASITVPTSRNKDDENPTKITFPSNSSIPSSLLQPYLAFSPTATQSGSSSPHPHQLASFHSNNSGISSNSKNIDNNSNQRFTSLPISTYSKSNLPSPFHIPKCNTTFQLRRIQKRKKNLTVIENFIKGWKGFRCNETITYTTHGDYRYLENLVPLVDRWNGPVSLAIYCPGEDLEESLKLISYLKLCTSSNIDKWVTFHLIYDAKYLKRPVENYVKHGDIPWLDTLYEKGKWKDCSQKPTFSKGEYTFRIQNGLLYPINIARNIARAAAKTYFVLASDIELYPSIEIIPMFMSMLGRLQKEEEKINLAQKNAFTAAAAAVVAKMFFTGSTNTTTTGNKGDDEMIEGKQDAASNPHYNENHQPPYRPSDSRSRHVFVLPVFEVKKDIMPCQVETKEQLTSLLKHKAAVLFHHTICPQCHSFPKYDDWKEVHSSSGTKIKDFRKYNCSSNSSNDAQVATMKIFHKGKRKYPFQLWEPIYIGSKEEPIYDERLSWEGLRDKMVSGYVMCALNYDFYILDNAFLVHKPGIRKVNHLVTKTVMSQDRLINYRIRSELLKKFGKHDECAL